MLNNLVKVKEEIEVVKITKTKITYDRLIAKRGADSYDTQESSGDDEGATIK